MIEDMRKYLEAGLGSLSPTRAREMSRSLLQGQGMDQVNRLAQDLLEWSKRGRERITELVQSEVKRQLRAVGVATRDDLDALRRRVRELEKAPSSAGSSSGSTAKRSTTRKSTARKPTAKSSPARKSPARKSTARKSTARKSTARKSTSRTGSTQGSTSSSPGSSSSS